MVVMYYVALGLGLISQYFARTTGKVLKYPYEEWVTYMQFKMDRKVQLLWPVALRMGYLTHHLGEQEYDYRLCLPRYSGFVPVLYV